MKRLTPMLLASIVFSALSANSYSEESSPVIVTANRFELPEMNTPFAAEIYSSMDIQQSGADSLYDFLDQYTSITALPSFGNPFVQKLDMRGYGIGDGYQNMVVTLNGRRLNNVDMVPQLLSSISLESIEKIEITKGSGSVIAGDGAMAGTIHIYTKTKAGVKIGAAIGSHGQAMANLYVGQTGDKHSVAVNVENSRHDGYNDADTTGKKDQSENKNYTINGNFYPANNLELRVQQDKTEIDTTYPGHMTMAEFNQNPAQNSDNNYTHQSFESENTSAGISYDFSENLMIEYDRNHEKKRSEYISPFSFKADYVYDSQDLAVKYNTEQLKLIAGTQVFDGLRKQTSNNTSKKNVAWFTQGIYKSNQTSYSAGYRKEKVEYTYAPKTSASLNDDHNLEAYELGFNHQISSSSAVFTNYQYAYQAPDIDRFFNFGGTFNQFIEPAKSKTINIGFNNKQKALDFKATLYYSKLENEIYYNASSFKNTNIDNSRKYGLDLFTRVAFNPYLSTSLNYAYTVAIIDSENDGNGEFDGKTMPGVSKHAIAMGLQFKLNRQSIGVNHTYRSAAFAANDFSNSQNQKQPDYNSTNILYRYQFTGTSVYAGIDNLFDRANGILVREDRIYPVNATRTWKIGFTTEL